MLKALKKVALAIAAVVVAFSLLGFLIAKNEPDPPTTRTAPKSATTPPQLVEHDFIQVGNNSVHLGDLSDDALPVLKPYIISNAGHRPDPRPGMSGSMMIWYYCDTVRGQTWTVELARRDMDSPYVVYRITEGEHNYQREEN